jgi:hypothetical protein
VRVCCGVAHRSATVADRTLHEILTWISNLQVRLFY